ncbi:hypothetical protein [Geobacter sp. AOG2]|uniref:hypothetical protein n=1 Tax=Geobacter sp. AOG2 TaxID=1566347 RepID=UPI001CC7BACD|nr:hypothetical protein [Geobacter sp. AOG2]GFE61877.1 hypothetical protein AOG2_24650 [Geobacter sp. AOG2]
MTRNTTLIGITVALSLSATAQAALAFPKDGFGNHSANKTVSQKQPALSGTVAELYKNKNTLNKKKVAVRGKVVKVATGIMGKNWVHLRDGSGSAKKRTNDLTVTTRALPNEGSTVTAVGILHKDRDFGAGYKYELIIEDAELQP